MIILGLCLNDFDIPGITLFSGKKYYNYRNPFVAADFYYNQYLFLHSNLYRFILFHLEKTRLSKTSINTLLNSKLDGIINICSERKIRIVGLIWPYLKNSYTHDEKMSYSNIKTILDSRKIDYIDLHDILIDREGLDLRLNPGDCIHFSDKAFNIMVEKGIYPFVFSYLKRERLL